ncbi:TIGR02302 family protein [Pseudophaeobacter profundi]|uniref:TIGR02302 family protein n=1 Tax=Pseudophaeobacter profundi TaxID=3034152 RepID=UPI0028BE3278|nr:TIGR02302 family protein [Pseudophaeobacter profundi]
MARHGKADPRLHPLRWPLRLTQAGMLCERALRAFWPLASVVMAAIAALMLGLHDLVAPVLFWIAVVLSAGAALGALAFGLWRFRWPHRNEALARLDANLPGRPVSALLDTQAIGQDDAGATALWQAHQARMAQAAAAAKPAAPNLRIAAADPFALRYVALIALVIALIFGSLWRVGSLTAMVPGGGDLGATGPSWEGWIEPPRYTGLPVLYLNDQAAERLELAEGSRITLRFYGSEGALQLKQSLAAPDAEALPAETAAEETVGRMDHAVMVQRSGQLEIQGRGGRSWTVAMLPDQPPQIAIMGLPELTEEGALSLRFLAQDDYGVTSGKVRIALDLLAVPRHHGLAADPEKTEDLVLDLPLPVSGSRQTFEEVLIEDFAAHPWANLPVTFHLSLQDAAGQSSQSAVLGAPLVAPRFFDPLAAAVAEQRRDLLWARANTRRVTQLLRALSHRPQTLFRAAGNYLQMRAILRRLEAAMQRAALTAAKPPLIRTDERDEAAAALWALAQSLEEGDIGDALARMQQAKERLSQAMRDGASDEEIAQLMQKLREATQDYMRQLQRQAQRDGGAGGESPENAITLSQQDLQAMMDRIQELMEQGRMAEAEQALEEFQRMMENMRMSQNQQGQGGSDGQQAMEDLGERLQQQQGLSDQAFRNLQEQFNPNAQTGESQQNEGRSGGQGRGQQHQGGQGGENGAGQQGQDGQSGDRAGQNGSGQAGGDSSDPSGGQAGSPSADSLAAQQRALREALRRQQEGLPLGQGSDGAATAEALDRAGRAMDGAEEALRRGELAEAIDQQSEAMEALREGLRALGEALAENQQPGQGQGAASPSAQADPLGRDRNGSGLGDERNSEFGEGSGHRRAWDLLKELRRRAGEMERSEEERNYFERLLEQF